MAQGNQKSNKFAVTINAKKDTQENDIRAELLECQQPILQYNEFKFVASQIHDKDYLPSGEKKRTHYHFFIELYETKTKAQMLKLIVEILRISENQISIEPTGSEILQVQYLTHKNDKNKAQYEFETIATNNYEELEARYNRDYKKPQDPNLTKLWNSNTLTELVNTAGLEFANKYRNLFKDIQHEKQNDIEGLQEQVKKLEKANEQLRDFTRKLLNTLNSGLKDSEKRLINLNDFEKVFEAYFDNN